MKRNTQIALGLLVMAVIIVWQFMSQKGTLHATGVRFQMDESNPAAGVHCSLSDKQKRSFFAALGLVGLAGYHVGCAKNKTA